MRPSPLVAVLVCCLFGCGDSDSGPDTLVSGGYDDAAMEKAIERARGEVDVFIAELENPTGVDHAVKAPVEDGGQVEHFWLTDVVYEDGRFTGRIGNDPGIVGNVSFGQEWTVAKDEISDWMYLKDEKIHGNYTMRPLLETLPPEEAAQMRAMLADP